MMYWPHSSKAKSPCRHFLRQCDHYFHVAGGHDTRDIQLTQHQNLFQRARWRDADAVGVMGLLWRAAMEHRATGSGIG